MGRNNTNCALILSSCISIFAILAMCISEVNLAYNAASPLQPVNKSSSLSGALSISSQELRLVDQIAQKIVDSHPSINYDSVKTAIEALSLQSKNNGENVNKGLDYLLQHVTINGNGPVVKKIIEHAMKESTPQTALNKISSNLTTEAQKPVSEIPELSMEELSDKGFELSMAGKYTEAMPYFDQLLKLDPLDAYALYEKASLLYGLGEYEEAILYLDRVLRLNQNDTGALLLKGHALNDLGKHSEAILYYDKLTLLDPSDTYPLFEKGRIYYDLGQYEDAIRIFDKAITINPMDTNSLYWKGHTLIELGRESEAKYYFDQAMAMDP